MAGPVQVRVLSPIYVSGRALTECLLNLCAKMQSPRLRLEYWAPGALPQLRRPWLRTPLPGFVTRALYRLRCEHKLLGVLERRYVKAFAAGDVAWLWPGTSVEVMRVLKELGYTTVLERINSCQESAKRILDDAYQRLGWPPSHPVTDAAVEKERRRLALADWLFCPSPFVAESFVAAGVAPERILMSSYAWDPQRFRPTGQRAADRDPPTFLFVASGDVRKGLPLLLRYWHDARIEGRLLIAGRIAPDVERHCRDLLQRDDVVHMGFLDDLAPIYDAADVFVLPSHEEGSPLVSYMALAAGLPCLTSPAASSGLIRHDVEGLIQDPYDQDAWIEGIRRLADEPGLRARLGAAARLRAAEFTWDKVAERRRNQLEAVLAAEPRPEAKKPESAVVAAGART